MYFTQWQRVCYRGNQGNSWVFQLTIGGKSNPKHRSNSSYVSQREAAAGTLSVTLILLRNMVLFRKTLFLSVSSSVHVWIILTLQLVCWSAGINLVLKPKEFKVNCRRRKSDLQPIGINWEEVVWIGWPCRPPMEHRHLWSYPSINPSIYILFVSKNSKLSS